MKVCSMLLQLIGWKDEEETSIRLNNAKPVLGGLSRHSQTSPITTETSTENSEGRSQILVMFQDWANPSF